MNKLVVITGPTATGKSALAVEIARLFDGEIISADSRQVYRGLDIGSAKITEEEMQDVPHHMIDIANPSDIFTVAEFQKMAKEKIEEIRSRGKFPIICGGTGMYISAVIDDMTFPEVPPDMQLRRELEELDTAELFEKLQHLDPARSISIDPENRVRLIRAIEIATSLGSVPRIETFKSLEQGTLDQEILIIGLTLPKDELVQRITNRITARIPALFDEIRKLIDQGITPDRLRKFGLEYRYGTDYVEGLLSLEDFKQTLATKTWQFTKRQMTWWKRDVRVVWMNPVLEKQKIVERVQDFLFSR